MSPEEIIQSLMEVATPERAGELCEMWARYHPKVVVVEDKSGITLDATKERIEFDPRTMEMFWLIGFSGWRAIERYMPHVVCPAAQGRTLHELFDDDELPEVERAYKERLAAARSLIEHRDAGAGPWPEDIPRATSDREALENDQDKTASTLS